LAGEGHRFAYSVRHFSAGDAAFVLPTGGWLLGIF
jgi:hypothetical protein